MIRKAKGVWRSSRAPAGNGMNSTHLRRVIAAGMIGNVLEWYDFAIYGYFAAQIGRHFFPHEDPVAQLLSAFGIFAAAPEANPPATPKQQ
jgi:hypothetical protein